MQTIIIKTLAKQTLAGCRHMAKQAKRTAIYFDEYPNCRIRERSENMKSHELADKISTLAGEVISPEAIRQWRGGYVRPDMSKIPAIAKALDCTSDYLFGIEAQPNHAASDIHAVTGLSETAITTLKGYVLKKDIARAAESSKTDGHTSPVLNEIDILNKLLGDTDHSAVAFFDVIKNYLALARYEFPMVYMTSDGSVFTDLEKAVNAAYNAHEPLELQSFRSDIALRDSLLHNIRTTLDIIAIEIFGPDYYNRSSYRLADDIREYDETAKIMFTVGNPANVSVDEDEQYEQEKK